MRPSLYLPWRQRTVAHAAVAAFGDWRSECAAVWASSRQWVGARREEEPSAFSDHRSALGREERAAKRFARLMRRGDAGQPALELRGRVLEGRSNLRAVRLLDERVLIDREVAGGL